MALPILKKRSDFLRVGKKCISVKTTSFVLQCALSPYNKNHFGFTATRRTGNAVKRNRSKRRMRSLALSLFKNSFDRFDSLDFVFIARSCTPFVHFQQLKNDFTIALQYCLENLYKHSITKESM